MERTAEFPDSHVVDLAEQFLDTAVLLLRNIPHVVAPSALRVNASFAIELFIKSLISQWKYHSLDELGFEGAFEITTETNVRGHRLADLFEQLPKEARDGLASSFSKHALANKHGIIEKLLVRYSDTFQSERYRYERRTTDYDSQPISEVVELAEIFRGYVTSLPKRRYAIE